MSTYMSMQSHTSDPPDRPDRFLEAPLSPLPVLPEMDSDEEGRGGFSAWTGRKEWPVDWASMVENSLDPSHAMFLHDGTFGFNSKDALPMAGFRLTGTGPRAAMADPRISDVLAAAAASVQTDTQTKKQASMAAAAASSEEETVDSAHAASDKGASERLRLRRSGFVLAHRGYSGGSATMNATRAFLMPCTGTTRYSTPYGKQTFLFYFVPTRPGYCSVIGAFHMPFPPEPPAGVVKRLLLRYVPEWASVLKAHDHVRYTGLDQQDVAAMRPAAIEMRERGQGWRQDFFLPTNSDVGVLWHRRWLDRWSRGRVGWVRSAGKGKGAGEQEQEQGQQEQSREREEEMARERGDAMPPLELAQLTDRWDAHGKDCRHCKTAVEASLRWLVQLRRGALAAAALAVLAASLRRVLLVVLFAGLSGGFVALFDRLSAFRHSLLSGRDQGAPPALKINYADMATRY